MHQKSSGDQWRHYRHASPLWPPMIIKHAAGTLDQLGETLPAMRRGMRVVHPGLKPGWVIDGNIN